MASYNRCALVAALLVTLQLLLCRFDRNCHRDAILIAVTNSVTSVFSATLVFSILGFMAHLTHQEVGAVVAPGTGLAFIVYPEVLLKSS